MFNIKMGDVTVKYKEFEALKNISCTLEQGKVYGLIGRNGAGKTTLLSVLSGFMEQLLGQLK